MSALQSITAIIMPCVLIILLNACSDRSAHSEQDAHLKRAETYLKTGQLRSALAEIKQSPNTTDSQRYQLLCIIYDRLGSHHIAIQVGDQLLQKMPQHINDDSFWEAYLHSKLVLHQYSEVLDLIANHGHDGVMWKNYKANALMALERNNDSKALLELIGNKDADSYLLLATLAHMEALPEVRDNYLQQALKKDPKHYSSWMFSGRLAMDKQDYVVAQQSFSEALATQKNYDAMTKDKFSALSFLVASLKAQGQFQLAQELSKELEEITEGYYKHNYAAAVDYYKQGNMTDAEATLKPLMKNFNAQGMPYVLMSLIESRKGDRAEAEKYLQKLDDQSSADNQSKMVLAKSYFTIGNYAKAEKVLAGIDIKSAPNEAADIRYLQGLVALRQQSPSKAKIYLLEAIKIDHRPASYQRALALAEFQAGNRDKAQALLIESMLVNPNNLKGILAYVNIASDKLEAENTVKDLYKNNPRATAPAYALALMQVQQRDTDQALFWVEKVLIADPTSDQAIKLKARLSAQIAMDAAANKDWLTAQRWLTDAIKLQPQLPQFYILSANLFAQAGEIENALAQVDKINSIIASTHEETQQRNNAAGDLLRARLYAITGDYASALEFVQKSWQQQPSRQTLQAIVQLRLEHFPNTHAFTEVETWHQQQQTATSSRLLAMAYQFGNADKLAIAQFEKTLKINPQDYISLNNLAWLMMQDNPKKALAYATRAHSLQPDSVAINDTYGWLLFKNQQTSEALDLLESAYQQSQNNAEIGQHLAEVYRATGQTEKLQHIEQEHSSRL